MVRAPPHAVSGVAMARHATSGAVVDQWERARPPRVVAAARGVRYLQPRWARHRRARGARGGVPGPTGPPQGGPSMRWILPAVMVVMAGVVCPPSSAQESQIKVGDFPAEIKSLRWRDIDLSA